MLPTDSLQNLCEPTYLSKIEIMKLSLKDSDYQWSRCFRLTWFWNKKKWITSITRSILCRDSNSRIHGTHVKQVFSCTELKTRNNKPTFRCVVDTETSCDKHIYSPGIRKSQSKEILILLSSLFLLKHSRELLAKFNSDNTQCTVSVICQVK